MMQQPSKKTKPPLATPLEQAGAADRSAIERTLSGERWAFEEIVSRHERAVFTLLHRMTGSIEDAEDLSQETFLRAYRSLEKFDATRPLRPWLLRIAANATLSLARRKGRILLTSLNVISESTDETGEQVKTAATVVYEQEKVAALAAAAASLNGEAARLYRLHYTEAMAVECIAQKLGTRPNTIAVALHRLRNRLRRIIEVGANSSRERRGP